MSHDPKSKSLAEHRAILAASVEQCRENLRGVTDRDRQEAGEIVAGMARSIELGEHSLAKIDAMEKACITVLEQLPNTDADCPPEVKELVRDAQALFRALLDELTNPTPTLLDELTRANVPK
jgi:hypothetical protein